MVDMTLLQPLNKGQVIHFGTNRFLIHCVQKKQPLTFSFVSPWIICGFKQKLQWIYPRIDRLWQCKN